MKYTSLRDFSKEYFRNLLMNISSILEANIFKKIFHPRVITKLIFRKQRQYLRKENITKYFPPLTRK